MNPVATSDAAFRGGACPTPEYTIAYTGNYTTSADANKRIINDLRNGCKIIPNWHKLADATNIALRLCLRMSRTRSASAPLVRIFGYFQSGGSGNTVN
jgi:hypothetical protein